MRIDFHTQHRSTPSLWKYLSENCIKIDVSRTKIHLDTSISPTSISGGRKYYDQMASEDEIAQFLDNMHDPAKKAGEKQHRC